MLKTSDEIKNISKAMMKVQDELGVMRKDKNHSHFKINYLTLDNLLMGLKPICTKNGLLLIQSGGMVDQTTDVWAKMTKIITKVIHVESGEYFESEFLCPMGKLDPQGMGSSFTYGRRYGLCAVFSIPQVDDDGEACMPRNQTAKSIDLHDLCRDSSRKELTESLLGQFLQGGVSWGMIPKDVIGENPLPSGKISDASPQLSDWCHQNEAWIADSIKTWIDSAQKQAKVDEGTVQI